MEYLRCHACWFSSFVKHLKDNACCLQSRNNMMEIYMVISEVLCELLLNYSYLSFYYFTYLAV